MPLKETVEDLLQSLPDEILTEAEHQQAAMIEEMQAEGILKKDRFSVAIGVDFWRSQPAVARHLVCQH